MEDAQGDPAEAEAEAELEALGALDALASVARYLLALVMISLSC